MRWVEIGRGYWRSADGRFEVMTVEQEGVTMYAVAYDFGRVKRKAFEDRPFPVTAARRWCELRAGKAQAA